MLNILCGFSVNEIAAAFLSGAAAVKKRIFRAKQILAGSTALFDLDAADVIERLAAVQRALYLLFNEGYHGASPKAAVRAELCREALQLVGLLLEHPATATPASHALCALMCFGAARLPAKLDAAGELTSHFDQDRSQWDAGLMAQGLWHLEQSASGSELTE